ncbi:MAG TPA: trigger factor [Actinomycetota bacterium]|nr:trigger factor [Actinomycetota bacterium]
MATPTSTLQTTTEQLEKDRVKLRVEVPEAALQPAVDAAYRKWANEIRIPGFRKGKVPRQMIDARVGADVVREEALRDALPELYREAMAAEDLEAIAPPEIDVVEFEAGSPIVFEATVDVRPEIAVPDLASLEIEAPPSEVTDEDLDEQIERLRDRFAELEPVGRNAMRGDHVLIDLKGYQGDELVEGLTAPDFLYEVGSHTGPAKLDDELEGTRPGAILKFTDQVHIHRDDEPHHDHSSTEEVSFTVLVKEVKAKKLPPVDDDFAKTVGEFDSLDDLREDLRARLATVKERMSEDELRNRALTALVDASDLEPPPKLVESEFEHRIQHLEADLKQAGMTLDSYGAQVQLTELEIRRDMREQASRSVKAELLLEEIARQQEVDVSEEELGREIALAAAQAQRDPKEVAQNLVDSGRVGAVAADIMRRKALDYVVRTVNVTGGVTDDS